MVQEKHIQSWYQISQLYLRDMMKKPSYKKTGTDQFRGNIGFEASI